MFSWKIHSGDLKEEDQQYMQDVYTHFSFELASKVVFSALWFFLLYAEWLIWTLALFSIFLLFETKKKWVWRGWCRLAPSALPHWLPGCQKVKGGYGPLVPAPLTLNRALFLNTIIVSGCHLKEMLHVQLLQKWWVVLPSKAMFIALPFAEDGRLPLLLAALWRIAAKSSSLT